MSFIKLITFALANELDRTLISLFSPNPNSLLDEQGYQEFFELIMGKNKRYSKFDAINGMVKSCQKQTEWQGALRHLMVTHKLIHDLGENSLEIIPLKKMQNLARFATPDFSAKVFVHNAIVSRYYDYLQKLSNNYEDLSLCFYYQDQINEKLSENSISPLHSLSKLQNTLRNLMKILPAFETSLHDFTPCTLVRQAAFYCLTDCIHYYTYINQILEPLINEFFSLPDQEAILLYETYSEHIIITRKLESFSVSLALNDFPLKSIKLYKLDPSYNSKMELYIQELRGSANTARSRKEQPPQETLQIIRDAFISSNASLAPKDCHFESADLKKSKAGSSSNRTYPKSERPAFDIKINGDALGPHWSSRQVKSKGDLDMGRKNTCGSQNLDLPSSYPLAGAGGPSFSVNVEDVNNSPLSSHRSELP